MKTAKKLFVVLLALVMVLAMAVPAFADEGGTTKTSITITPKDNGTHTFTAYQIFKGELSNSGVLSNVEWGADINGDALIAALKADTKYGDYFKGCTTAASVAEALDKMIKAENVGEAGATAALTAALETENVITGNGQNLNKGDDGKYTISNIDVGYYVVKDAITGVGAKASDMILQVVGEVVVDAKAEIPQVTKEAEGDSYGIGDEITYTLTATVPDFETGTTEEYKLEFTDTMDPTLDLVYTYQANESLPTGGITVKMDETDVTGSFKIGYDTTDHILTIKCADISKITGVSAGSVFTVTYKAKINSTYDGGAVTNRVSLVTKDYTTTDISENVFPIKLQIEKVNGADTTEKLPGAEFVLQNEDGKYLQVSNGKVNGWVDDQADATTLVTGDDGLINVAGLAAGTYTLTETKAPDKYNKLTDPVTLEIAATVNKTGDALDTLTISVGGATAVSSTDKETVVATIENNQGAQLPSTGGIGTTLFYVLGGLLVAGAAILLVTRRRMRAE